MKHSVEELESLLLDWEAGTLEQDGIQRLREILRNSEQARTTYLQHQVISAALQLEGVAGLGSNIPADPALDSTSARTTTTGVKSHAYRISRAMQWHQAPHTHLRL